ncbi:MAG: hypothetical protein JXR76_23280 [Deltaproteobacteria bacterium]|nr:hypothetical protein [Deltaproteobacteria bacterium]
MKKVLLGFVLLSSLIIAQTSFAGSYPRLEYRTATVVYWDASGKWDTIVDRFTSYDRAVPQATQMVYFIDTLLTDLESPWYIIAANAQVHFTGTTAWPITTEYLAAPIGEITNSSAQWIPGKYFSAEANSNINKRIYSTGWNTGENNLYHGLQYKMIRILSNYGGNSLFVFTPFEHWLE